MPALFGILSVSNLIRPTMSTVIIKAKREKYSPEECETLTVAELIRKLERLNPSAKVVLSHDGGHTYGGILQNDIKEA